MLPTPLDGSFPLILGNLGGFLSLSVCSDVLLTTCAPSQSATPCVGSQRLCETIILPIGLQSLSVLNQGLLVGFPRALVGVLMLIFAGVMAHEVA